MSDISIQKILTEHGKELEKKKSIIYISTSTRRIYIRLIKTPNKQFQLAKSQDRDKMPKEKVYYLGLSVIKNNLIVKELEEVLSVQ